MPNAKKPTEVKVRFYQTPLHALLLKAMPQHAKNGRLSPIRLATALGLHKFTVYKWLGQNKISPDGAAAVIKESGNKLTVTDLAPFVIS